MKTLTLSETRYEIINYIKSHKKEEELYIDFYKNNDVFSAYELLNNNKLFPLNETQLQKDILNEELLKNDLSDIFSREKEKYLKFNNSKNIAELDIDLEDENAFYLYKDINLYRNGILKFIIGFNYDENKLFSSVAIEEDFITPCRKYSSLEKKEERNSKQWVDDFLINNKEILTKNIAIKTDKLTYEKIKTIIKNFIYDYDKKPLQVTDVLQLFNKNEPYLPQLFNNKELLNYEGFKNKYTIRNEKNIFHLYHFPNLYLNCLYKDTINYLNKKNNNIFSWKGSTMNMIPIKLNNSNYQQMLKCDYNLFFDGKSLDDNMHLYAGKKIIMSIPVRNRAILPELLFSLIENDIKSKIKISMKEKNLLEIEHRIKTQLNKPEIEIKVNFQKEDDVFAYIKKDVIPIKIIYKDYNMNSLFNYDNITELKNEIESFIEKISLDEIFVNTNNIKKNNRL